MRIQDRILEYLQKGKTITALQCQQMFGSLRLSAFVYNLRKEGYNISSEVIKGKNRYGDKISWNKYKLEE